MIIRLSVEKKGSSMKEFFGVTELFCIQCDYMNL